MTDAPYEPPISISKEAIAKLRSEVYRSNNGDGYTYLYIPEAESEVNVTESMKMDAIRHKLSPSATDLANRAKHR